MRLQRAARAFVYPPTPDIARATRMALHTRRRVAPVWLRLAAALLFIAALAFFFVPGIRAGVVEFLRVGAVRILFNTPLPASPVPDSVPFELPAPPNPARLQEAAQALSTPIYLPSYPPDLGMPDALSIERSPISLVTLIWYDSSGDEIQLVLQMIGAQTEVAKYGVPDARHVSVNGEFAVWIDTPHSAEIQDTNGNLIRGLSWLVKSNVLVWMEGGITYRLETDAALADAIQIAESLRMMPNE